MKGGVFTRQTENHFSKKAVAPPTCIQLPRREQKYCGAWDAEGTWQWAGGSELPLLSLRLFQFTLCQRHLKPALVCMERSLCMSEIKCSALNFLGESLTDVFYLRIYCLAFSLWLPSLSFGEKSCYVGVDLAGGLIPFLSSFALGLGSLLPWKFLGVAIIFHVWTCELVFLLYSFTDILLMKGCCLRATWCNSGSIICIL